VQGNVVMGVRPSLPMAGVQVILGNDVAGSRLWPDVSVNALPSQVESENPTEPSAVHAACAVTRGMTRTRGESNFRGSLMKGMSVFPLPRWPVGSTQK